MPAKSKSQQEAAGIALAVMEGKMPMSRLRGASKGMYQSMNQKQLRGFAKTKRSGLPDKKGDKR